MERVTGYRKYVYVLPIEVINYVIRIIVTAKSPKCA